MKLKQKVITTLMENKTASFTIKELSKKLNVDYKNTYDAVRSLESSIRIEKKSNATYISFKPVLTQEVFLAETERKHAIIKSIPILYKDILSSENPLFIAVLFGSFAKKTQNKHSDIDLCIIHDNEDEISVLVRKLSIHKKLEIHAFSYKEFISMLKINDFNVGKEIRNTGIPLHNIESYYELLKHG
jgi:predicted nucleotidyltransferase